MTLTAVFLFGVVPALLASRGDLASPLRFDTRAGRTTRAGRQLRRALVAVQVALALVMLAGAGLLVRSLARLQGIDLGYNPEHLAWLNLAYSPDQWKSAKGDLDQKRLNSLGTQLLPVWRAVPGVTAVTPTLVPPFLGAGIFVGRMDREGQSAEEIKSNPMVPIEVGGADTSGRSASRSSAAAASPSPIARTRRLSPS